MAGAFAVGRVTSGDEAEAAATRAAAYPFRGEHQAGIATPAQDRLHFAAFDVTTDSREELVELLQAWTSAAEQMTKGEEAGATGALGGPVDLPPEDTGEAIGLPASGLTITFGFGPTLFRDATARTGSASPTAGPRPSRSCRTSPPTCSTRSSPAATCASRPAPTTRRWRCTPSATS